MNTLASVAVPPTQLKVAHTTAVLYMVFCIVPAAVFGIWALVRGVRQRDWVPLLALAGGALCSLVEPVFDVLTHLYWPSNFPFHGFTLFDRPIPGIAVIVYACYTGLGAWWVYDLMRRGTTVRTLTLAALVFACIDLILEIPWLKANVYVYYGYQPFRILDFPAYWPVINASLPILGGWLFLTLSPRMVGWGRLLALVVPTISMGGVFACGWPTFAALNSEAPHLVLWLAAVTTMALSAGTIWLIASWVATSPTAELAGRARIPGAASPEAVFTPATTPVRSR